MENSFKLTRRTIRQIEPGPRRLIIWDSELSGFGLRVEVTGSKSYVIRYRADGGGRRAPQRFMTIGKPELMTPEDARQKAREHLSAAICGEDPAEKRKAARKEMTVSELCDLYLAEAVLLPTRRGTPMKQSTLISARGDVRVHIVPLLGTKRLSAVTSTDIERFMLDVATGKTKGADKRYRGGKAAATHAVTLLSAMFTFAKRRALVKANPCHGVVKYASTKRERFLSTDELERLGEAIREGETTGFEWRPDPTKKIKHAPRAENRRVVICPYAAAAIRLLLLTGARKSEIVTLRWDWVDFERGILFLPDSKTGKKAIILNRPALDVLAGLEERGKAGPYVIRGASADDARSDLKKPWAVVTKRAGLEGLRLHDLRHTHASFGVAAGFGLPIVGKLLGHTQPQTTARYAHLADDPTRRASDAIGRTLAQALEGRTRTAIDSRTSSQEAPLMQRGRPSASMPTGLARRAVGRRGQPDFRR
jgi:integrase